MNWLAENWYLIVTGLCTIMFIISLVLRFTKYPTSKQIENIKEWLKWAVTEAEKNLGGGTGQLKLRMVYNMAVEKFPIVGLYVPFDTFSTWVDYALDWMRNQLSSNSSVEQYVNSETTNN